MFEFNLSKHLYRFYVATTYFQISYYCLKLIFQVLLFCTHEYSHFLLDFDFYIVYFSKNTNKIKINKIILAL